MNVRPELSSRPHQVVTERDMTSSPQALYRAWTEGFDVWFAAPGTVLMRPAVDDPFFFQTDFGGARHPHYGRFLVLDPDRRVELTWVTAATQGAETVVEVRLEPLAAGTHLRLTHAGLPDEESQR